MMISGMLGRKFGVLYLFLDPEYMGEVSFSSFFLIGLSFSAFLMAWNTTMYIINSNRFPFLASLSRPFVKFCLNNSIIPLTFIVFYLGKVIYFQWYNEFELEQSISADILGFLSGLTLGVMMGLGYFGFTNKDVLSFQKAHEGISVTKALRDIIKTRGKVKEKSIKPYKNSTRVDYYLSETLRTRICRNVEHYDYDILDKVYRQNHANALIIQIVGITVLILMGLFIEHEMFRIPAAASMFILFSVITTILGALTYWMREWRAAFLIAVLVGLNYLSSQDLLDYENKAYGLNYSIKPVEYSHDAIDKLASAAMYEQDKDSTIAILERWQNKASRRGSRKPKMVFICTSGGGLRSAAWTTQVMQQADSMLQGRLMRNTVLMTGASGGMLGLGYFREVYYRQKTKLDTLNIYDKQVYGNITKDCINAIGFTVLVNDLFVPWVKFSYNDQRYFKDRGYIFEQQLNTNCGGVLDKPLKDYYWPERNAEIPLLLLTPTIVSDGRQLVISPQGMSYMSRPHTAYQNKSFSEIDAVEFSALFKDHDAGQLRYLSALRMNATFPYILPNVYLPTKPRMQVMDAGFRDNQGIKSAARFIEVFADWIRNNTDGVVFVCIRGSERQDEINKDDKEGFLSRMFNPLQSVGKFTELQDFAHDDMVHHVAELLGPGRVDYIDFEYRPAKLHERASMSLHLTLREKMDIQYAIYLEHNQEAMKKLRKIIR